MRSNVAFPVKVEIKILLGAQTGPGVGKLVKMKGKTTGYLVGAASKTRINETAPIFYLRPPEGKGIEEVVLIAFDRKKDRREIDMGPAGPKKEASMRQFDSLEVGPRLFRVTPTKLSKGEYFFLLMGSAEPPKGSQGKGHDFGVDAPAGAAKSGK